MQLDADEDEPFFRPPPANVTPIIPGPITDTTNKDPQESASLGVGTEDAGGGSGTATGERGRDSEDTKVGEDEEQDQDASTLHAESVTTTSAPIAGSSTIVGDNDEDE